MKGFLKFVLDIVMGAVIPILILSYLTRPFGAPTAYVTAALVPVCYVLVDMFFITRRFNFITSYMAATAILNGALAFWFVDGARYAFKDTVGPLFNLVLFGGSLLINRPILQYFVAQALNPDTAERRESIDKLMTERQIVRSLMLGTLVITIDAVFISIVNFIVNLSNVTAVFGTDEFNQQVARVTAFTRVVFPIASLVTYTIAIGIVFKAFYQHLPKQEGVPQMETQFMTLIDLYGQQQHEHSSTAGDHSLPAAGANL
ncbi:MAG TPA: VC0807 family protein [Anaerolineae bacterium]